MPPFPEWLTILTLPGQAMAEAISHVYGYTRKKYLLNIKYKREPPTEIPFTDSTNYFINSKIIRSQNKQLTDSQFQMLAALIDIHGDSYIYSSQVEPEKLPTSLVIQVQTDKQTYHINVACTDTRMTITCSELDRNVDIAHCKDIFMLSHILYQAVYYIFKNRLVDATNSTSKPRQMNGPIQ